MPFVDAESGRNATNWWGDVEATVDYCVATVARVCAEHGGDASKVFVAGFSRGAIACNYIGLHDDRIASLWRGFICHSCYDGMESWPYAGSGRQAAAERLKRLGERPQFICNETDVTPTRRYLEEVMPEGNFTFLTLPFDEHTDTWVLRDIPERALIRTWFGGVVDGSGRAGEAP